MEDVKIEKTVNKIDSNKTLDNAVRGTYFILVNLPSGIHKVQLIRMGLSEGDKILCLQRLPGGTMIIRKNRQEIAIGYHLAKEIKIRFV